MSENTILEINEISTLIPTSIPISSIKEETYTAPAPVPVPISTPKPTPISITSIKEETYTKPAPKRRVRPSKPIETNKKEDSSKTSNDMKNNDMQKLKMDKYILEEYHDIVRNKNVSLNYNFKKTLTLKYF